MRIIIDIGCWKVVANWFGEDRIVFTGTVWECIAFVADNS